MKVARIIEPNPPKRNYAILELELTPNECDSFIEIGVVSALRDSIERMENEQRTDRNREELQSEESFKCDDI